MKITPIAYTQVRWDLLSTETPYTYHDPIDADETDADELAEFAGRACYQSWNRPNPKTATNAGYLANILAQGHESVLEHASVTFYVEGVSRSLTHELVRHRHLSYSELSQRFVNMEEAQTVDPPAFDIRDNYEAAGVLYEAQAVYKSIADSLIDRGYTRKQAREAARAVMPNATETKIVVSGNHRAFRDVLKKRWHVAADAEIRQLAGEFLKHLRIIAPNIYQDVPTEPFGSEK